MEKEKEKENTTTTTRPTNSRASVQLGLLIDQLINRRISRSPLPLQRLCSVLSAVSCVCPCVQQAYYFPWLSSGGSCMRADAGL
jgi:hypothetical protein